MCIFKLRRQEVNKHTEEFQLGARYLMAKIVPCTCSHHCTTSR